MKGSRYNSIFVLNEETGRERQNGGTEGENLSGTRDRFQTGLRRAACAAPKKQSRPGGAPGAGESFRFLTERTEEILGAFLFSSDQWGVSVLVHSISNF